MAAPQRLPAPEPLPTPPAVPVRPRPRLHPWLWAGLLATMALTYRGLLQGAVIAGRDVFRLFIPDGAFLRECLLSGKLPLWNPYVRLGEPFVATLQSQAFYPPNLLAVLLFGPVRAPSVLQLFDVAVGACGMFLAARRFGRTVAASALAGAVLALSPFFAQAALVPNIAGALAWGGFVLLAAHSLARRPDLRGAALLAIPLALSALCGAPEITLCEAFLALSLAGLGRARGRALGFALLGCGWAVALASVALLPTAELSLHSARSLHLADLSWSTSWPQLLSVVTPFVDLPRQGAWGPDQGLFLSLFLGTTPALLCALSLRRERRRAALALLGLGFALLCLGDHFPPARFVLSHPPFALFRYPAKAFAGLALCFALLAAFGLDRVTALARRRGPDPRRAPWLIAGASAVFAAGFVLLRKLPVRAGLPLGLGYGVLMASLAGLCFLLVPAGPARPRRVRAALLILVAVEFLGFALRLPVSCWAHAASLERPSTTARALGDLGERRVSVVLPPDPPVPGEPLSGLAYVDSARDGLVVMQSAREHVSTVEGYGSPEPERLAEVEGGAPRALYDLLGVGAYVRPATAPYPDLREVHHVFGVSRTFLGGNPMPRAFVVYRAAQVDEAGAGAAIADPEEPFRATAFLEGGSPLPPPPGACRGFTPARVMEGLDRVEISLDACAAGELVLTDRFYPGWEATLDGKPVPIARADWLVRGVRVPAGHHAVVMRYRPWSFRLGALLSLAALAALFAARRRTG